MLLIISVCVTFGVLSLLIDRPDPGQSDSWAGETE
jgi:hypothetical protein